MNAQFSISEIFKKYKHYNSEILEIWEDFTVLEFYLPILHRAVKKETIPTADYESAISNKKEPFVKKSLYGVFDRLSKKVITKRALIDSVSVTESFFQEITFRIYQDFEHKLQSVFETPEQQSKLLKLIIESNDKTEIIHKIAEEKIRGIFYGNPSDFFVKDKAQIGINDYLKTNYKLAIEMYKEIIARRNLYVHNNGRVDRKYLREIKSSSLKFGQIALLTREYIKESIVVLQGISAIAIKEIMTNTYGVKKLNKKFGLVVSKFEWQYKGK